MYKANEYEAQVTFDGMTASGKGSKKLEVKFYSNKIV